MLQCNHFKTYYYLCRPKQSEHQTPTNVKAKTYLQIVGTLALLLFFPMSTTAQTGTSHYTAEYRIDSLKMKELRLDIDNLFFFKNNEFKGTAIKGYTLPGAWINPKISYRPLSNIKFEAGLYMLSFSGAYKYPNYAYQDIAVWKGNHYQDGTHWLPYFRGQIALGNFNFVLGNLYGGTNHKLILPLFNPELNLTSDPESGFQILYDTPGFHFDAWINWQSFIFETDTHQEAFIAGVTSEIRLNSSKSKWHWYVPLQFTTQHRGGELDIKGNGVQTLTNGAVGLGVTQKVQGEKLQRLNWEIDAVGYYQQKGNLWPFDKGFGWYGKMGADFKNFTIQGGAFSCHKFISIMGSPFFGAVSTSKEGAYYKGHPLTTFTTAEYYRTYDKLYSFGIKGEAYYHSAGTITLKDGTIGSGKTKSLSLVLGAYFRLNLSILLKKASK